MNAVCCALLILIPFIVSAAAADADTESFSWSTQYGCRRAEFEVAGSKGFVILPPNEANIRIIPWVWYAPTFIGSYPSDRQSWIAERLLANGIALCGVEVGESYGSPSGRAVYTQFHRFVIKKFRLAAKACLWPQSRGGLMLYNWAVEHPRLVQCIGGTYTVCDITSYPGIAIAAPAYGMTEAEFKERLAENNPIDRLEPLARKKVPVFHIHGDVDTVVPLEANSAKLVERYKALGGPAEVEVIHGKGHEEVAEFFENQKMVDFFVSHAWPQSPDAQQPPRSVR